MEIRLTILGKIPSKKNSKRIICRGKFPKVLPSELYVAWHKAQMLLIAPKRPKRPLERCFITIRYFAPDKRTADLDNKNSSICDLLKDAGYVQDDNWFVISKLSSELVGIDKKNPRAEIEVLNLNY